MNAPLFDFDLEIENLRSIQQGVDVPRNVYMMELQLHELFMCGVYIFLKDDRYCNVSSTGLTLPASFWHVV